MNIFSSVLKIAEKYYDEDTFYHAMRVTVNVANDNLIPSHKMDTCILLAIMHDLIEDTKFSLDDYNFDNKIITCLDLLSKNKDMTYEQYLVRIKENYDKYPEAYWVKLADIKDHLLRTETLTDALKEKYLKTLPCLL